MAAQRVKSLWNLCWPHTGCIQRMKGKEQGIGKKKKKCFSPSYVSTKLLFKMYKEEIKTTDFNM
jgi:hypothetical protein